MKTLLKISLLSMFLFGASSCINHSYETKRQNIIVPGLYSGINYYGNETLYLKIEKIYQEQFELAKGVNVIKDCLCSSYYSLYLYYLDNGIKKEYASFLNFIDAFEEVTNELVTYKDSYNSWFIPSLPKSKDENNSPIYCTLLSFNSEKNEYYIGSILFLIEE